MKAKAAMTSNSGSNQLNTQRDSLFAVDQPASPGGGTKPSSNGTDSALLQTLCDKLFAVEEPVSASEQATSSAIAPRWICSRSFEFDDTTRAIYEQLLRTTAPDFQPPIDQPAESWALIDGNRLVGHVSLWYENVPDYNGLPCGYFGHFFAASQTAATATLEKAEQVLARYGAAYAIGPINGNTWRNYRLVIEDSSLPRFIGEPTNSLDYSRYLTNNNYQIAGRYTSSIMPAYEQFDPNATNLIKRLEAKGVEIRTLDATRFEQEIDLLFDVAKFAFQSNFLYSPITREEFKLRYAAVRAKVDEDLVLIAEQNGRPVGFVFAVPAATESEDDARTVIIKTVARNTDPGLKGLGRVLMHLCHRVAYLKDYRKVIHALYKDDNISGSFSERKAARIIRRYAIFAKEINPCRAVN
ncbi:MAG: hypothetical protein K2Z81_02190 [Cyanobacteria bacterium]|nr:hypothetical protein [Cyanobacteriota bacterium]